MADGGIGAKEVEDTAIITELPAGVAADAFITEDCELLSGNAGEGSKLEPAQTLVFGAPVADTVEDGGWLRMGAGSPCAIRSRDHGKSTAR